MWSSKKNVFFFVLFFLHEILSYTCMYITHMTAQQQRQVHAMNFLWVAQAFVSVLQAKLYMLHLNV